MSRDVKHAHVVSSVCGNQDEGYRVVQEPAEVLTLLALISGFPGRQGGKRMSTKYRHTGEKRALPSQI